MDSKTYIVLAIIEAKPGKAEAVKEILASLINPTLREEGCVSYDFHESLTNPHQFMFYENWSSQEAHQKHENSSHIHIARSKLSDMVSRLDILFWKRLH